MKSIILAGVTNKKMTKLLLKEVDLLHDENLLDGKAHDARTEQISTHANLYLGNDNKIRINSNASDYAIKFFESRTGIDRNKALSITLVVPDELYFSKIIEIDFIDDLFDNISDHVFSILPISMLKEMVLTNISILDSSIKLKLAEYNKLLQDIELYRSTKEDSHIDKYGEKASLSSFFNIKFSNYVKLILNANKINIELINNKYSDPNNILNLIESKTEKNKERKKEFKVRGYLGEALIYAFDDYSTAKMIDLDGTDERLNKIVNEFIDDNNFYTESELTGIIIIPLNDECEELTIGRDVQVSISTDKSILDNEPSEITIVTNLKADNDDDNKIRKFSTLKEAGFYISQQLSENIDLESDDFEVKKEYSYERKFSIDGTKIIYKVE